MSFTLEFFSEFFDPSSIREVQNDFPPAEKGQVTRVFPTGGLQEFPPTRQKFSHSPPP